MLVMGGLGTSPLVPEPLGLRAPWVPSPLGPEPLGPLAPWPHLNLALNDSGEMTM